MTSLQQHEADLVVAVRLADDEAFAALATQVRPWLVATCARHLSGDQHQAEDIAQECLVKLHSALRRDDRPLRVRPWLAVVARNACIDHARRSVPEPVDAVPDSAVQDDDPFELDPALDRAWSRLAARHREALQLRELVGLSYEETARAMGTTVSGVETLLFRARAALRREYQRAGGRVLGCGAFVFALDRLSRGGEGGQDVATHVASCGACQEAVAAADRVGSLLRGVPLPDLSLSWLQSAVDAVSRAWHRWASVASLADPNQVAAALVAGAVAVAPLSVPGFYDGPVGREAPRVVASAAPAPRQTPARLVRLPAAVPAAAPRSAPRALPSTPPPSVAAAVPTASPSPSEREKWSSWWRSPSPSHGHDDDDPEPPPLLAVLTHPSHGPLPVVARMLRLR
ncbi:MAG: polymerase sigma factor [Frankiales bacterium]|nr:polymerase sigma factor [Frankiales bacterium]